MKYERCPKCESENIYQDTLLWVCPECSYEWADGDQSLTQESEQSGVVEILDANGNVLSQGDSVIVIKELKIKGSSGSVKSGTKVRNIRLTESDDGHNIACKIEGLGSINLKSEFVKKA